MTKTEMIQQYEALSKQAFNIHSDLFRLGKKDIGFPRSTYARPSYTKAKIQECINEIEKELARLERAYDYEVYYQLEAIHDPTYGMMASV